MKLLILIIPLLTSCLLSVNSEDNVEPIKSPIGRVIVDQDTVWLYDDVTVVGDSVMYWINEQRILTCDYEPSKTKEQVGREGGCKL